jgi:excisionase family DNA binding protein
MEKDIYTVSEVARRLMVTTKTVRAWIAARKLTAFLVGREWRIREQDIQQFIDRHLSTATLEPRTEPTMNDTRDGTINIRDLYDIHNELSPMLETIEVLIDLCIDVESDEHKTGVLHTVLESEAAKLRNRLDALCSVPPRVAPEEGQP